MTARLFNNLYKCKIAKIYFLRTQCNYGNFEFFRLEVHDMPICNSRLANLQEMIG